MSDVLINRHDQTFPRLAERFPGGRKLRQGNRPAQANGRAKSEMPANRRSTVSQTGHCAGCPGRRPPGAAGRTGGEQRVTDLCATDAVPLAGMLGRREVSARDVIAAHVQRIEAVDGAVNAVVTRTFDAALDQAARRRGAGPRGRARPAARPAGRPQGSSRHGGRAHHLRLGPVRPGLDGVGLPDLGHRAPGDLRARRVHSRRPASGAAAGRPAPGDWPLLQVAHAFEAATGHGRAIPPVLG